MTAKEFLEQYRDSVHEVRRIEGEIAELRERAVSLRSSLSGEPCKVPVYAVDPKTKKRVISKWVDAQEFAAHGNGENTIMAGVDDYIDQEFDRLRKAKANTLVARREVVSVIDAVQDARLRELLSHRYISLHTWEWIAETMICDKTTVWRWHGDALGKVKVAIVCNV